MVKRILFFLMLISCCKVIFAQRTSVIIGKIQNENDEPLQSVHITLLKSASDSSIVSHTISNIDGNFKIENSDGIRPIKFTCIGYATKIMLADSGDIGTIILSTQQVDIEEITVSRQLKTYRPDGITYIPSDRQVSRSINGMDLLSNLHAPRVRIDPMSYNISALGGGEVVLLINDRPASVSEFRALDPDLIRRVDYYDKPTSRFPEAAIIIDVKVSRPLHGGSLSCDLIEGLTCTYGEHFLAGNIYSGRHTFSIDWQPQYRRIFTQMREREDNFNFQSQQIKRTENALPARLIYWNNEIEGRYNFAGRKVMFDVSAYKQIDKTWNRDFSGQIITQTNTSIDTTISHENNTEKVSEQGVNIYSEIRSYIGTFRVNANYSQGTALNQREFNETNALKKYLTSSDNTENKHHTGLQGSYTFPFSLGDSFDGKLTWKSSWRNTWYKNAQTHDGGTEISTNMRQNDGDNSLGLNIKTEQLYLHISGQHQWMNYIYSDGEKHPWSQFTPGFYIGYTPFDWWESGLDVLIQYQQVPIGQLIANETVLDAFQVQRTNPNLQKQKFNQYTLNNTFLIGDNLEIWLQAKYQHTKNPIMDLTLIEPSNGGYLAVRTQENLHTHTRWVFCGSITFSDLFDILTLDLYGGCDYNHSDGGEHYQHKGWYPYTNSRLDLNLGKWSLIANIWYGEPEALWGEMLKTADLSTRFMLAYQHKRIRASIGIMNPFIKHKETRLENLSSAAPYVRYVYNQAFQNMVFARLEFNLSWGDKQRERNTPQLDATKPGSTIVKSER